MRAFARVVVWVLLFARVVRAEPDRPFSLQYSAPADCPNGASVVTSMEKGSRRVRPAAPGEPAHGVRISVSSDGTGFVADLTIQAPDGTATTRSVPAPTCTEAVDAAALIAVITIDPESMMPPPVVAPAQPGAVPEAPANMPAPSAAPAPSGTPPPIAEPSAVELAPERRAGERHVFVHAAVGATAFAMSPSVAPDFAAGVGYDFALGRAFSPRFDLSVRFGRSSEATDAGDATFQRLGGRLNACPLSFRAAWFAMRPCAFFEMGLYRATGVNVDNSKQEDLLWTAVGATADAAAIISPTWAVGLQAGPVFPITRGTFTFLPNHTQIFEIPPVGLFFQATVTATIL